jgi:hypothetical protein
VAREEDEWPDKAEYFLKLYAIDTAHARLQVRKLMRALDAEALEVLRVARRLETRMMDYPPSEQYAGPAILARLGNKFTKRHVDLAELVDLAPRLSRLSKSWYAQGGKLLDGVEQLRIDLALYEHQLAAFQGPRKRGAGGRSVSIAWAYLIQAAVRLNATDEEVAQYLVRAGFIPPHEIDILRLKETIGKHRWRRRRRLQEREQPRDKTKTREPVSSR